MKKLIEIWEETKVVVSIIILGFATFFAAPLLAALLCDNPPCFFAVYILAQLLISYGIWRYITRGEKDDN